MSENPSFYQVKERQMQQGIIFDIKRFAIHDGPGIRLTVFFKGCPMRCWWCHNPEGIATGMKTATSGETEVAAAGEEEKTGRIISVDALMAEVDKEVLFFDESGGGVTFSGGEPLMQVKFLETVLERCRDAEIHTALDTSGFCSPASLKRVLGLVDLFLYDLKLIDNDAHKKFTGVSNQLVLENLRLLAANGSRIKVRFPVIPGITDSDENIRGVKELLSELPAIRQLALLPFHNIATGKYERLGMQNMMAGVASLPQDGLKDIKVAFESIGLEVSIGG